MKNRVYYNQEVMKMKHDIPSDRILVEHAKFAVSSELKRKEKLNLPVALWQNLMPRVDKFICTTRMEASPF